MLFAGRPLTARPTRFWSQRLGRRQGSSARLRGSAAAAPQQPEQAAAAAAPVDLQWNDIVEYLLPRPVAGATIGIGRVDEVTEGRVTLAPLEEEEGDVWVESHDRGPAVLPQGAVVRILGCDFSQRQDRESNPHGEHAHDVYTLLDPPAAGVYRGPRTLQVVLRNGGDSG